jgi:RNA polymerase sigma-70 factor (TIGR02943 family)
MQQTMTVTEKEEQFRAWVRTYSDMLFSHSIQRGFDHDAAKDLVQDTFISAWKSLDQFEGKASVKNWLFVILKNKIADHYRKLFSHAKVQKVEIDEYFDEADHWAKPAYPKEFVVDPADPGDLKDFYQIFENCSNKLNRMQKAVFFMKYIDDMESDTICGELSISANNYWTILHRAKVQLRSCLEKNWLMSKSI